MMILLDDTTKLMIYSVLTLLILTVFYSDIKFIVPNELLSL